MTLPLIDLSGDGDDVPARIDAACRSHGFFAVTGHGIDLGPLDRAARAFFALPEATKAAIAMPVAGMAWRGWFPLGDELTSGVPDRKEGLYFGAEEPPDGRPLHGPNQFPAEVPDLRPAVLAHLDAMTALGQRLLAAMAVGLGLPADHFRAGVTADPTILFRIFHYPPPGPGVDTGPWGVAEHTDYGLLTILGQDDQGGLEVHTPDGWIDVPADPGVLVCNLGDMLERMTAGRYRSTPHRVRPPSHADPATGVGRLSFPFFLDPGWDQRVTALPLDAASAAGPAPRRRWDGADPLAYDGTYGDYLTAKVAKVFPHLFFVG